MWKIDLSGKNDAMLLSFTGEAKDYGKMFMALNYFCKYFAFMLILL